MRWKICLFVNGFWLVKIILVTYLIWTSRTCLIHFYKWYTIWLWSTCLHLHWFWQIHKELNLVNLKTPWCSNRKNQRGKGGGLSYFWKWSWVPHLFHQSWFLYFSHIFLNECCRSHNKWGKYGLRVGSIKMQMIHKHFHTANDKHFGFPGTQDQLRRNLNRNHLIRFTMTALGLKSLLRPGGLINFMEETQITVHTTP